MSDGSRPSDIEYLRARVQSALSCVPPGDHDLRFRMGCALKSALGEGGRDLWDWWRDGRGDDEQSSVWKSIDSNSAIGVGSLFHEAKKNGWGELSAFDIPTDTELKSAEFFASLSKANPAETLTTTQAETAARAMRVWNSALEADEFVPYLKLKGIPATPTLRQIDADKLPSGRLLGYAPRASGQYLTGLLLVCPIVKCGRLSSLELIDGHRRKAALPGSGTKVGGYWPTGPLPVGDGANLTVLVGEGVATTLSASDATGYLGVAALSSSNLCAVARTIRKRFPAADLVILADLIRDSREPEPAALLAALEVGARLAIPDFVNGESPWVPHRDDKDFNDLVRCFGPSRVRDQIDKAQLVTSSLQESRYSLNPKGSDRSVTDVQLEELARSDVLSHTTSSGEFILRDDGVFFQGRNGAAEPQLVCSRIDVIASSRDSRSTGWGRLLRWKDGDGVIHRWMMPMELLQGDGAEVRRELVRRGVSIEPGRWANDRLTAYLQVWPVEGRVRCVDKLGWHESTFITPEEAIGSAGETVAFQSNQAVEPAFSESGTAEEWRDSVASLAAGNSRVVFCLSAAFAGSLLRFAGEESGGFHLRGGSTSGKSTALKIASSVWGHPTTYPRLWRATANGLEGLAAVHNDGLLILDELSQIDPATAGESAYLLANGQGKARASRSGLARPSVRWRLLFLSAGEESLSALMARAGRRVNPGQELRLAEIDSDAGAGLGAFETLHHLTDAAQFAEAIRGASIRCHGAVGKAWLRYLVDDPSEELRERVTEHVQAFVSAVAPTETNGQILRVARRFGIVAAAGQLATESGLTGWQETEAIDAVTKCFEDWCGGFGGPGSREQRMILAQVRAFFEAHGASRFEEMLTTTDRRVPNRAGYYRTNTDGVREFLVLPEVFRREVCQGFDAKVVVKTLAEVGWLETGEDNRFTQKPRIPGIGPTRCYVFNGAMWASD